MDQADLRAAQDAVLTLVGGLGPSDWSRATPCTEWDVADVLRHLVVGERAFATSLSGTPYDLPAVSAEVGQIADAGLPAAYETGAVRLREALEDADPAAVFPTGLGPMPRDTVLELRTIEALTHGWDLARATGRDLDVDHQVVEQAISVSRVLLQRLPPDRTPFDEPMSVDDHAPALDRLAGLLGRSTDL